MSGRFKSHSYYMRGSGWGSGASGLNNDLFIYQTQLYQQQRGGGIASIFSNLYSSVVPMIKGALKIGSKAASSRIGKTIIKKAKKRAMRAGLNVVSDALEGQNVLKSTKRELKRAGRDVLKQSGRTIANAVMRPNSNNRRSRKRKAVATPAAIVKRGSKKARRKDIFT